MAERDKYDWIEDFSILLTRHAIQSLRRDPDLELFTSSKLLASLWLAAAAGAAGSLGGLLPSGALWSFLLYPIVWLAVVVIVSIVVWRLTIRLLDSAVAFLAGWSMFWGMLTGVVASWGAELTSAGWAYGIAGGIGFLIGLIHGNLQHADVKGHDGWAVTSAALAPASACLSTWLSRADLLDAGGLQQAGLTGLIASLLFLGPVMAIYLHRWNSDRASLRLASLYLHNDDFLSEAIQLLDGAIGLSPEDARLLDRRALAHALKGNMPSAEADWALHRKLGRDSRAPDLSRGWFHLRQERLDLAAEAFSRAGQRKSTRLWATVGNALIHLRKSDPAPAVDLLGALPEADVDARNQTYLAQAHLASGNLAQAVEAANVAIDELDSIHGLSWLIRAEAQIGLGKRGHAIADLNRALSASDEAGIEERALAWLEKIEGDVLDDAEIEKLEQSLNSR